jgi:hypothetical protein
LVTLGESPNGAALYVSPGWSNVRVTNVAEPWESNQRDRNPNRVAPTSGKIMSLSRATPSEFSDSNLAWTQGCARFAGLTSLHPGLP